jgi:hypothetical protein
MSASRKDNEQEWRRVELPEKLVIEIEQLMKDKYEKRPVPVQLGFFVGELIRESLMKEEARQNHYAILEEYAVEPQGIYIKDNQRDTVAELHFKDGADLYCSADGAKNCVHVGFAWSLPLVQKLIWEKKKEDRISKN